jgi:putative membrane protein
MAVGLLVLAGMWLGPLPGLARESFSAHMAMHIAVVAVVAPLVAFGVAGTRLDPARVHPRLLAPIQASLIELVVVWIWHVPTLHNVAREETWALVLEQGSFLTAALWLWIAAVGGTCDRRATRYGAGVFGLLFTSMHMTLLGALLTLAPRPLYQEHATNTGMSSLADQHLGGAIMLLVGSAAYLLGGLALTAGLLRLPARPDYGGLVESPVRSPATRRERSR